MRILYLIVLLLSVLLLLSGTALAQDPGIRDTVRVAKVTTNAGQLVGVPITLYNDDTIGGCSLGFVWNSDDITADSVSRIGTRIHSFVEISDTIDPIAHTALVGFVDMSGNRPLKPGDGLLFTIWFTIPAGTPDQFVSIDSTYVPPSGRFILSLKSGVGFTPEFKAGEIKIGNPQPPPVIVLSQSQFTFSGMVGGTNPTSQVQQITNGGGQTLNWTATKLASWLVLTPPNGTAPSVMVVAVNIAGLGAGTYIDTVIVSAPGAANSPQKFPVTLTLAVPPPTIKLAPTSFSFTAQQNGTNPPDQSLSITNIGQGTLNWTATNSSTWLALSSYSGTAPSTVSLHVDNTGLAAGVYRDTIVVSDPTAINDPQYAIVTFEIFSEFPVIVPSPTSIMAVCSETQNPYARTLLIQNNGGGVMNWAVSKSQPWMSFNVTSGTSSQGNPGVVIINFDRTLVDFGQHRDTIVITSSNAINSPVRVPVIFWKAEVPQTLNTTTIALNFSEYECGSYPGVPAQSFTIYPGTQYPALEWSLTHKADWLTVTPTSGVNTTSVSLKVNVDGLTPGEYYDTLVISAEVAINPPVKVRVTLTVMSTPVGRRIGLTVQDSVVYIYKYTQVGSFDREVTIYNIPGGCVEWSATSDVPWVTPIPASGTTTEDLSLRSNAVGLSLGRHTGTVTFTMDGATNSPLQLPVVLWIYTFGDANGDGYADISDVVYLIEYIFLGGPAPVPVFWSGDVDCSRTIDISDVVYMLEWIFSEGPPPCLW